MGKGVAKFLVSAGGPGNFRLGLRQRTRAVRSFSIVFRGINGMSTRISERVLGGDLLELMSSYLKRLLLNSEESRSSMSAAPVKRSFADRIDMGNASITEFETSRAIDSQLANSLPSNTNKFVRREPFDSISGATAGQKGNLLSRSATTTARRVFEPVKRTKRGDWSIANQGERPRPDVNMPVPGSRLSNKLQEYWQLTNRQQSLGVDDDGAGRQTTRDTSGFPQISRPNIFSERSLAEFSGQKLIDKLGTFTSGLTLREAGVNRRTADNPDLLPHVEIQNTFHVEVKNEPGSPGSLGDLSDKVADILREQALQHGIDIT
jgi:hypothetical protein